MVVNRNPTIPHHDGKTIAKNIKTRQINIKSMESHELVYYL